jgi:hypothetical protein
MNAMFGVRVFESAYVVVDGDPVEVRRTWRERLCLTSYHDWLTQPFEPWRRTRTVIPKVPGMLQLADRLIVHPVLMPELRRLFGSERLTP